MAQTQKYAPMVKEVWMEKIGGGSITIANNFLVIMGQLDCTCGLAAADYLEGRDTTENIKARLAQRCDTYTDRMDAATDRRFGKDFWHAALTEQISFSVKENAQEIRRQKAYLAELQNSPCPYTRQAYS